MKNEKKELITVLNSSIGFGAYPIGNKILMDKVVKAEKEGIIKFNDKKNKWE